MISKSGCSGLVSYLNFSVSVISVVRIIILLCCLCAYLAYGRGGSSDIEMSQMSSTLPAVSESLLGSIKTSLPVGSYGHYEAELPKGYFQIISQNAIDSEDFMLEFSKDGSYCMDGLGYFVIGFSAVMGFSNSMNLMFVNDDKGYGKYTAMTGTSFLTAANCYKISRDFGKALMAIPAISCMTGVEKALESRNPVDMEQWSRLFVPHIAAFYYHKGWWSKLTHKGVIAIPLTIALSHYYAIPDAHSAASGGSQWCADHGLSGPEGSDTCYWGAFSLNYLSTFTMVSVTIIDIETDAFHLALSAPGLVTLNRWSFKELIADVSILTVGKNVLPEALKQTPYHVVNTLAFPVRDPTLLSLEGKIISEEVALALHQKLTPGGAWIYSAVGEDVRLYKTIAMNLPDVAKLTLYAICSYFVAPALAAIFTSHQSNSYGKSLGFAYDAETGIVSFKGTPVQEPNGDLWCKTDSECKTAMEDLFARKTLNKNGYLVQGVVISNAAVNSVILIFHSLVSVVKTNNPVQDFQSRSVLFLATATAGLFLGGFGQYLYLSHTTGDASIDSIRESQDFDAQLGYGEGMFTAEQMAWIARVALCGMFLLGGVKLLTPLGMKLNYFLGTRPSTFMKWE